MLITIPPLQTGFPLSGAGSPLKRDRFSLSRHNMSGLTLGPIAGQLVKIDPKLLPRQLYLDMTTPAHLPGLLHLENYLMTR
jgi:hypothetical protein